MNHRPALQTTLALAILLTLAAPTHAAEPPPCEPTGLDQAQVLREVIKWGGYGRVRLWQRTQVRLDPCKAANNTARMFITLSRAGGYPRGVRYEGQLILSIDLATGKPVDTPNHRGQVSRMAKGLPQAAKAAERNAQIKAWLSNQLRRKRHITARFSDLGGHGQPCLDYESRGDGGTQGTLQWCQGRHPLKNYTLVNPQRSDGKEVQALLAFIQGQHPGCRPDRLQMRPSGKTWQARARLVGETTCPKGFKAATSARGEWIRPKRRGR
jgi:hypothetical protein